MYCIKCGQKNADDALFCMRCGAKMPVVPDDSERADDAGEEVVVPRSRRNAREWEAPESDDAEDFDGETSGSLRSGLRGLVNGLSGKKARHARHMLGSDEEFWGDPADAAEEEADEEADEEAQADADDAADAERETDADDAYRPLHTPSSAQPAFSWDASGRQQPPAESIDAAAVPATEAPAESAAEAAASAPPMPELNTVEPTEENPAQPGHGAHFKTIVHAGKSPIAADGEAPAKPAAPARPYVPKKPVVAGQRTGKTHIPTRKEAPDAFDAYDDDTYQPFSDRGFDGEPDEYGPEEPDSDATFVEKHIRSVIAMALLVVTVLTLFFWSACTDGGKKTMAQLGLPTASGNKLVGDDYYNAGNYARAIEAYTKALAGEGTAENALALADAYEKNGDTINAARALIKCIQINPANRDPYLRLKSLYPVVSERSSEIQTILTQGATLLGDAALAE